MTYAALIGSVFMVSVLVAQPTANILSSKEDMDSLLKAKSKLSIDVKLDKSAYFPSEEIIVHLTVKNLSEERVQVPDPFSPKLARVMYFPLPDDLSFEPKLSKELVATFEPGEVKTYTLDSSNSSWPGVAYFEVGTRDLVYTYNHSIVKSVVRDGDLEVLYEIAAPEIRVRPDFRQRVGREKQLWQRIFSIRSQNLSHLCVSLENTSEFSARSRQLLQTVPIQRNEVRKIALKGKISQLDGRLGPMRCVGTSPDPVESIEATYGNDGSMLVILTNSNGQMQRVLLDIKNSPIR